MYLGYGDSHSKTDHLRQFQTKVNHNNSYQTEHKSCCLFPPVWLENLWYFLKSQQNIHYHDKYGHMAIFVSNKHAPIKTSRLKVRSNPWMTSDIVKFMYKRDRIHNLAAKRKDDSLMDEYRKLRNSVTDMIKKNRKKEYFTNVRNSSRTNPRSFWEEFSSIIPKINVKSIPRNMNAEDFNIYFKNVHDLISSSFVVDSSLLWKGQESIYTFMFIDVQRNDLINLLLSLSDKTGMDILGFNRRLVRHAGEHIVDSLSCIINDSLSNGTFPDDWKLARVTPVYKNNGDVNIMSNYRPISVIGHIAKMVEQFARSQLESYLEEHAFISPNQSAYLKGHLTVNMVWQWMKRSNTFSIKKMQRIYQIYHHVKWQSPSCQKWQLKSWTNKTQTNKIINRNRWLIKHSSWNWRTPQID